jgi:hypothetical protein
MHCECCGKIADLRNFGYFQKHHKFSQTKVFRGLYGNLLDHKKNIQHVCRDCHTSHRSEKLIHWTEIQYCRALKIKPRSVTGWAIWSNLPETEKWKCQDQGSFGF